MFTQTAEYALRAMACLALYDSLVATSTLADQTKVPVNYLAKVLQQLSSAGLVDGRRGVGGGYRLSRPATEINLLDVINAVVTLKRIETCPLGLKSHGSSLCPLHRRADKAIAAIIEIYQGSTLADLVNEPGSKTPLCEDGAAVGVSVGGKPIL